MRKNQIFFQSLVAIIYLTLDYVFASQQIIKSQWKEGYSIFEKEFDTGVGNSYQIQFYIWIIPQVGNSLLNKMQITRISTTKNVDKTNESTSKVLLISVNTNEAYIQIESFEKVFKINLPNAGVSIDYYQWTLIKINQVSANEMTVQCGQTSKTTIQFQNSLTNQKLYLYMGVENDLGFLPFNGFYAFEDIISSNPISAPTIYSNKGVSNKLAVLQRLGQQQTRFFESDNQMGNDQMINQYSIKFGVEINGYFITKKLIIRMTMDSTLNDERNLGYCIICVYIYQKDIIFETYSYDATTSSYVLTKKTLQIPNAINDVNTEYIFVIQYNGNNNQFQVFDSQSNQKQQIEVKQIPLINFAILHGGNFVSDTLFAGKIRDLMINYGQDSLITTDINSYKKCQEQLCSSCDINSSSCNTCLVSDNDPNKKTSLTSCDCEDKFYFDINSKCSNCHSNCKTCSGPQEYECTSCKDTRELISGQSQGYCVCKERYFDDNLNSECKKCHDNCLTCNGTGINNCQTCPEGRYVNSIGECVCKSNFYLDNGACNQCKIQCQTCNSKDSCLTCGENQTLNPQTKQCECNVGYYEAHQQGSEFIQCYKCTKYCKKCTGAGEMQCIKPENKFILHINTKNSTIEGSCVHKKFIETKEFGSSFFKKDQQIIEYCVLGVIIIDFLANIYANKFGFSRVFRMQQFILKIFYLKLIDVDFLQSNYELLTSLSFFNGINNLYSYINPFGGIPAPPKSEDRVKIKLEEVSSNVLYSSGGVIFLEILLFVILLILAIIVKCRTKAPARAQSSSIFSNPNDNSVNIDRPMITPRNEIDNQQQSNLGQELSNPNTNIHNQDAINRVNNLIQHVYWHFHEYGLNICCFGCIMHLAGPIEEQQEIRPDNFFCYLILLYIIFVCLFLRSWVIRKPKQKDDLLKDKLKAIEIMKILERRKEKDNRNIIPGIQVSNHDDYDDEDSEYTNVLAHQNSPENNARRQSAHQRQSLEDDRSHSLSSGSEKSNENQTQKAPDQPNYKKWLHLHYLYDSVCLHGIFECLHMEFIPLFKGCKFYFWVYLINYFSLAASVIGPHNSSNNQYICLCFAQLLFMIVSFFRPYQDILESIKNIVDNVIFFIVVVLQFVLSMYAQDSIYDFELKGNETQLNSYSWACFSLLLFVMVAFMGISIAQVFLRRKNALLQQQNPQNIIDQHLQSNSNSESQQYQPANLETENNQDKALANKYKNLRNVSIYQQQQNVGINHSSLVSNQISQRKSVVISEAIPQFDPYNSSLGYGQFDPNAQFTRTLNLKRSQQYNTNGQAYQTSNVYNTNYNLGNNTEGNQVAESYQSTFQLPINGDNSQINYSQDFNILRHLQQGRLTQKMASNQRQDNPQNNQGIREIELENFQYNSIKNKNLFSPTDSLGNVNSGGSQNPEEYDNKLLNQNVNSNSFGQSIFDEDIFNISKPEKNLLTVQLNSNVENQINSPSEEFKVYEKEFKQ